MESVSEESFYSKCSSDKDLPTLTEWSESPPDIIINFVYEIGKKPIVHCYDSSGLKQWLNNPENSLAEWISTSGEELHPMGFGGGPDLNRKYVKLYTGEFVEGDENIDKLRKGLRGAIFTAIPMGIKRIGNIFGTFGVSEHHGQLPGYPTYKLQYISSLPYIHKEEEETETEEPEEISEVDEDI